MLLLFNKKGDELLSIILLRNSPLVCQLLASPLSADKVSLNCGLSGSFHVNVHQIHY